jgi:hypothetical protein
MRNIGEKTSRLKEGIKVGRKPSVQIVFPIIYLKNEFLAALLVYEYPVVCARIAKCSCNAQHTSGSNVMRCVRRK